MTKAKTKNREIAIFQRHYFEVIVEEVNKFFPVPRDILLSPHRKRVATDNRYMIAYLLRKIFLLTLTDIGSLFSRDHSTIMHGLHVVEDWKFNNPQRWAILLEIEKTLLEKFPSIVISPALDLPAALKDLEVLKAQHKNFGHIIKLMEERLAGHARKKQEVKNGISESTTGAA